MRQMHDIAVKLTDRTITPRACASSRPQVKYRQTYGRILDVHPARLYICLLTVVTAIGLTGVAGMVRDVSLAELVDASEVILVGTVVEVRDVEGIRVARVEVEQTIKGPTYEEIWYLAQGTWACDITSGKLNERAILLLNKYEFHPEPDQIGDTAVVVIGEFSEPMSFRASIERITGDGAFWAVSWAGRGHMPIRRNWGREYAVVWTAEVRLPKTLSGRGSDEKIERKVPFADLLGEIAGYVAKPTSDLR